MRFLLKASTFVGKRLVRLAYEMAPSVLFFFVALMLILMLFKLFVAQYSVEFYAFGRAAVGALILGKAVLLMEWLVSERRLSNYPRVVTVVCKTILYGLAVLLIGLAERFLHAYRANGSVKAALAFLAARADLHRFLGFVLLISMMVGAYLTMQEIDRTMGKGALFRLFFERPSAASSTASKTLF